MEVEFVKVSPSENMTIIVLSDVDPADRAWVASELMAYGGLHAEQVGFLAPADQGTRARLEMAGGEFCGNAVISLASFLVWRDGEPTSFMLGASGADAPILCEVSEGETADESFATISVPLPESVGAISLPFRGGTRALTAVRMQGITHILVGDDEFDAGAQEAEALAVEWAEHLDVPALGLMRLSSMRMPPSIADDAGEGEGPLTSIRMRPLVCVRGESLVWERCCGSGSAALGAYLATAISGPVHARIQQPGGAVDVAATFEQGAVASLSITGRAKIIAVGMAYI